MTMFTTDDDDDGYPLILQIVIFLLLLSSCLMLPPCSISISVKSKPIEPATKAENGVSNAGD
jgi:hypothetical protein